MTYDTVIIGAGIIGCTCAAYLANAGQKVAVLDNNTVAHGTTNASFAWANASTKMNDLAYHGLNALGVQEYHALAREHGGDAIGINPTGTLFTAAHTDAAGIKDLTLRQSALTQFGYPVEMLDAGALRNAEPNLTIPDDTAALYSPNDLVIDGPKFTRFMLDQALAKGAIIHENIGPVELVADDNGVVGGVHTPNGTFSTSNVIVAAGQHTPEALAMLTGYDGFTSGFPLQKAPGLLLTTPPLPNGVLPRHVLGTAATYEVHFLPDPNGGVKIGSDDIDGLIIDDQSPQNMAAAGQQLLDRAAAWIPTLSQVNISDCHLVIGVRPYPSDGKSIIGPMPHSTGLFVVATHSGITLAPAIARYMADTLTGATPAFDAAPFSLSRFAGFT